MSTGYLRHPGASLHARLHGSERLVVGIALANRSLRPIFPWLDWNRPARTTVLIRALFQSACRQTVTTPGAYQTPAPYPSQHGTP